MSARSWAATPPIVSLRVQRAVRVNGPTFSMSLVPSPIVNGSIHRMLSFVTNWVTPADDAPVPEAAPGDVAAPPDFRALSVLFASFRVVIARGLMCWDRTAFLRSCVGPTLRFGTLLTAYPVPPIATKRATIATIIAGEGRCFHKRI